jgi:hypothetical protein
MRPNVKQFVEMLSQAIDLPRPVVDVGSLRVPGQEDYADVRPFFPGDYIGLDMRAGPGVEALGSIHHLPVLNEGAGTVLVLDTLEHVLDPILSMQEVCRGVAPGGIVVITSHMNFPIHAHPSDYWRFTPMTFDHLMRPLATRFVFMQGDPENPHNVMACGMKASADGHAEIAFRAAVRQVQARWPDDSYGGPLVLHESLLIDVSQRASGVHLPELIAGRTIAQGFTCNQDGLSRIDVKMSNKVGDNLRHVVLRLFEEGSSEALTAHRVLGWHVKDDNWMAMPVPSQARSAGKRYVLNIESPDGLPGHAVGVRGTAEPGAYAHGELRIDGVAQPGSLAFQTYCWGPRVVEGDVQTREDTLARTHQDAGSLDALDAKLAALADRQWEQVRHLADSMRAELDGIREQMRQDQAALLELQRRTLEASTEKMIARTVRNNPASRAIRKLRGDKPPTP